MGIPKWIEERDAKAFNAFMNDPVRKEKERRAQAEYEAWKRTATTSQLEAEKERIEACSKETERRRMCVRLGVNPTNSVFPYDPVHMFGTNSEPHSGGS